MMTVMKRILVGYEVASLMDIYDFMEAFGGYCDGDREAVVLPYSEELVDELECRGIIFTVEVM